MKSKGAIIFEHLSPLDVYVIDKVKALRKKGIKGKYISQSELGRLLGFNNSFISHIEMYRKKYSIETINLLAKIFKCSPKDFFPKKFIEDKYLWKRYNKRNYLRGYPYQNIIEMERNPDYIDYLKKSKKYEKVIGTFKIQEKHFMDSLKNQYNKIKYDYIKRKNNLDYKIDEENEKLIFHFKYFLNENKRFIEHLFVMYPNFKEWFINSNIDFPNWNY